MALSVAMLLAPLKSRTTGVQHYKLYSLLDSLIDKGLRICIASNTPPQRVSSETLLALSAMHRSTSHNASKRAGWVRPLPQPSLIPPVK